MEKIDASKYAREGKMRKNTYEPKNKKNVKNLQENLKLDALLYKVFDKNI